ncbi:MAG: alpha/beta hydrolase, partial [Myxococcota bacterium]|nr:alpha/beta hydrolase [Myxococcota bacterium]
MRLHRLALAPRVLALLVCLETFAAAGPNILTTIPESPNPDSRYVFYLHGKIIEDSGRRPRHPRFGTYEYDAILETLEKRGYVVISEKREPKSQVGVHANKTAEQIEALLSKGVPPDRITVVGFSKGGRIAQAVSAKVKTPIRYV